MIDLNAQNPKQRTNLAPFVSSNKNEDKNLTFLWFPLRLLSSSCPSCNAMASPEEEQTRRARRGMSSSSLLSCVLSLAFLALLLVPPCSAENSFELHKQHASGGEFEHGSGGLWRRYAAEMAAADNFTVDNGTFVLAAKRTYRQDPLNGYQHYTGGWNISNQHYWDVISSLLLVMAPILVDCVISFLIPSYLQSVGFTAIPLFAMAIAWFLGFGLALLMICCCYCCCRRRNYSYSRLAYALSLILLLLFTIAAIVGCVVLYTGQGKFHSSTSETLDYVVNQANLTVDNLQNFSSSLTAAKNVGVDNVTLPAEDRNKIDALQKKLNTSAIDLSTKTSENSRSIRRVLDSVRLELIIVAAVMLLLSFLGFIFSVFGLQVCVSLLVILGWILVTGTFILCGIFLLLHNVVGDTCVAMDEWVAHPHAHTALDDILPCVDVATANQSYYQSKEITFKLVNVVNQAIVNVSNRNYPPQLVPLYFNQSGPLVPLLCNPYFPDLSNRTCAAGEVDFDNATQVWKGYVCQSAVVSGNEICVTAGRITPTPYDQMAATTEVSRGLYYYGPFLVQLADCTFVRETFAALSSNDCPGLELYSARIYVGLALVSAAVMLSLIFWIIYARERRHRKYGKQLLSQEAPPQTPLQEKDVQ